MSDSIITISRQFGSGGRFIGKKLAETLGIPFFDNELITISAKESGYAESLFEKAEQISTHSLLYSLSMFGSTAGVYGLPLSDKVFLIQSDVIKKIAHNGPCVIVGRCADYVLRETPNCVNVFIHSPLEKRVERAVKYYHLDPKDARNNILKTDKKRGAYYNYYTGLAWGAAENYHLSVNSGSVGVEGCAGIISLFLSAKEKHRGADAP